MPSVRRSGAATYGRRRSLLAAPSARATSPPRTEGRGRSWWSVLPSGPHHAHVRTSDVPGVTSATRPPFAADERTQLLGWLDLQRAVVLRKAEGLSEADARRVVVPTSPLLTVAGLLSHLRWTEHLWFEVAFLGAASDVNPAFTSEDGDFVVGVDLPVAQLAAEYEAQCARSNEIVAAAALDEAGQATSFPAGTASLRWMVQHMLEETARHLGHLDLVRELLDGATGYYAADRD